MPLCRVVLVVKDRIVVVVEEAVRFGDSLAQWYARLRGRGRGRGVRGVDGVEGVERTTQRRREEARGHIREQLTVPVVWARNRVAFIADSNQCWICWMFASGQL